MIQRNALRWNGWGRLGESTGFSRRREEWLLDELGKKLGRPLGRADDPVSLDDVRLPPEKVPADLLAELRRVCGEEDVRTTMTPRIPSEPSTRALRSGPVAERGTRAASQRCCGWPPVRAWPWYRRVDARA
jgi:hypothetical protein